ncbi:MAG TPA: glycosyltransferase [Candidatus Aquabacterium excrementipullorum]|nr:glycosyltransferase [Candidatus Aquabacterium excrementipullorum]
MNFDTVLIATLGITLVSSFIVSVLLVLTQKWHGRLSLDSDTTGAQKFHAIPVPRIGGVGLFAGLVAGALALTWLPLEASPGKDTQQVILLLIAGLPAFLAGLAEDITKQVSISARLLATFISAALAAWLLDAQLTRVDTLGLDALMSFGPLALLFTCFAVGGVANAVNIIDGFNGLASGSVALMLAGLGALAYFADDMWLVQMCLLGAAACIGFMLLNYPFGKIFLGDGGAYLAGFWLAECAVLLLSRNPEVSTWAVLLACIYPVWETLFSIWRKGVYRKTGVGQPDKVHFHMLVFRRLIGQWVGRHAPSWLRHGLTSLFIWAMVLACQVAAVTLTGQAHPTFALAIIVYVAMYAMIYRSMVKGCQPSFSAEPDTERVIQA